MWNASLSFSFGQCCVMQNADRYVFVWVALTKENCCQIRCDVSRIGTSVALMNGECTTLHHNSKSTTIHSTVWNYVAAAIDGRKQGQTEVLLLAVDGLVGD